MSEELSVPQKTKAELFAEDPDRFIDMNDVALVIAKDKDKKIFLPILGSAEISGMDTFVIAGLAFDVMHDFRMQMRARHANSGIVVPKKNGFMQGVRNLGRR